MVYGDFKDLKRRTFSDKVLRDKAFKIAKNPKYYGYQRDLASTVINFLIKSSGIVSNNNNNNNNNKNNNNNGTKQNLQLADELHKPTIRKFEKRKVYSSF